MITRTAGRSAALATLLSLPGSIVPSHAATPLQPVTTVQGYADALHAASGGLTQTPAFPTQIPVTQPVFAYADSADSGTISFDRTADCHGAHYCNIGTFRIDRASIDRMKDMKGRSITRRLRDGTFFTPAHVMADSFPAQLQWRAGQQTVTISWANLPPQEERATLTAMRHSVK
ncbi:hypothetical protein [Neoasaia chiangmaiensis]|uniref:Lipoprotein n=1 Tax=Neoasaia chiangmaiensis TaxID=320497 RepID=A0A1U9KPX7_9PROT|nr:hypothetical protein [Neoasaia chiangmaiensis]AQS87838.1 hypothetical protein A0U93_07690 [Neoasaia chiangmaiensis]